MKRLIFATVLLLAAMSIASYASAQVYEFGTQIQTNDDVASDILWKDNNSLFVINSYNIILAAVDGTSRETVADVVITTYEGYSIREYYQYSIGYNATENVLYYIRSLFDPESEHCSFEPHEDGNGFRTTRIAIIEALDLDTDERQEIARLSSYTTAMSFGKDMIAYSPVDIEGLNILNLSDGTETRVIDGVYVDNVAFTADDQNVLYSIPSDNWADGTAFYMVPVGGGDSELFMPADPSENSSMPVFSSDGEWLAYRTQSTVDTMSYYFQDPDGSGERSGWGYIDGLIMMNQFDDTSYDVKPYEDYQKVYHPAFSPDGSKFAWILNDPSDFEQSMTVWYVDFETLLKQSIPLAVDEQESAAQGFALSGNYPNPFNPTTTISFALPAQGFVTLDVYNIAGQKVRTLVSNELHAGNHEIVWNGRDDRGNAVSSGVYLTHLRFGEKSLTNRMTLMK